MQQLRHTVSRAVVALMGLSMFCVAAAASCTDEVGADEAQTYVDQCIEVSPATRPPCNAENACQLIWDEISRGCSLLGSDAPAYCDDY